MHDEISPLQAARVEYQPLLPKLFKNFPAIEVQLGETTTAISDIEELARIFPQTFGRQLVGFEAVNPSKSTSNYKAEQPLKIGVVFSGGQAPGGHNVISGLFDAIKALHPQSQLLGFLNGPIGIIEKKYCELTLEMLAPYRNQGGFDLIGSGRTKIESKEQLSASSKNIKELELDGLVIIGGDDSNTNAAILAEFFKVQGLDTAVVGVPKTIDGDLKNEHIATSFGFDTACKIYAELIGNIARDALSAKKYYHFIKLMGRSASHITLECALQTRPNLAIIGEEVADNNYTLKQLTELICDMIIQRAKVGKDYGVILIPEGLIEFIPEIKVLITELNGLLAAGSPHNETINQLTDLNIKIDYLYQHLNALSRSCFASLTPQIQQQLLLDRDPHGNVQVSKIETEKLLMDSVATELLKHKQAGNYSSKFNAQQHFLGYEGRAAMPSNFDCQYCYGLGFVAALLVHKNLTGYMSQLKQLKSNTEEWQAGGIPITMLMNIEQRHGHAKPVIQKALVTLNSKIFTVFQAQRKDWIVNDLYRYSGPMQFFGERAITDIKNYSLMLS